MLEFGKIWDIKEWPQRNYTNEDRLLVTTNPNEKLLVSCKRYLKLNI